MRLLLVDDEIVFLKTLVDRLKRRGIPAMTADCGRRCLEILDAHPMDVIILDVKIHDRNGLEVLNDIKLSHPETEVIFLTGHGSTADGVSGINAVASPVAFIQMQNTFSLKSKIRNPESHLNTWIKYLIRFPPPNPPEKDQASDFMCHEK